MALSDTAYSRLVAWLKILLPLTALAILSTLFLLARTPDIERAIPYADVDIESLAREPRISEPDFSGVSPDGTAVSMRAISAQPDPSDPARFFARGMEGVIETPEGLRIRTTAVSGVVDTTSQIVILAGDVLFETSTGYAVRTERLRSRLDSSLTESDGPVDVMAPFGHLTAGQMLITRDPANDTSNLLVFRDGVDLLYEPGN